MVSPCTSHRLQMASTLDARRQLKIGVAKRAESKHRSHPASAIDRQTDRPPV